MAAGSQAQVRLNQKPERYLKILDAVAKLTARDADELLSEVFGATSLAGPNKGHEAEREYADLAVALRQVMQAVSAKHGLREYFQAVACAKPALTVASARLENGGPRLNPEGIEIYFSDDHWSIMSLGQ